MIPVFQDKSPLSDFATDKLSPQPSSPGVKGERREGGERGEERRRFGVLGVAGLESAQKIAKPQACCFQKLWRIFFMLTLRIKKERKLHSEPK